MSDKPQYSRFALCDWSHYWLTQAQTGGVREESGPWRYPDRCFAARVARGYNAARRDAVPHLIAPRRDGPVQERFELLLPAGRLMVNPRAALLELAHLARRYQVKLWLTSDFLDDTQARRRFVRRPQDFVWVWSETLHFLQRNGLLDTVAAVDFCQNFAAPASVAGASRRLFGQAAGQWLADVGIWPEAVEQRLQAYLHEVPRTLRALFPNVAFGVSCNLHTEKPLRLLDTTELDFIDGRFLLNQDLPFRLASGALLPTTHPLLTRARQHATQWVWQTAKPQWQARLEDRLSRHADFTRVRRLQCALTGGFVSASSRYDYDWGWVKEVSEFAIDAALQKNALVLSPAAQAQPLHQQAWQDVAWLQAVNRKILRG